MQQTTAQALGRKGERWFQNAIPKEWIFQRPTEDFGLDGTIMLATANELSGLEFGVQVKASAAWVEQNGYFAVAGISYRTLMRWLSPFLPTVLVLYDEPHDRGYYAWVKQIAPAPEELIVSRPKTLTLKVPANSVLEGACWRDIETWVYEHNLAIVHAVETKNITATILPTIHRLTHALQLLLMLHSGGPTANEEDEWLQSMADIAVHKSILRAITELAVHPYLRSPFTSENLVGYIEKLRRAYLDRVSSFVDPHCLFHEGSAAFWINREQMISSRPELIFMITQGVAALSSVVRGGACEFCDKGSVQESAPQQITPG